MDTGPHFRPTTANRHRVAPVVVRRLARRRQWGPVSDGRRVETDHASAPGRAGRNLSGKATADQRHGGQREGPDRPRTIRARLLGLTTSSATPERCTPPSEARAADIAPSPDRVTAGRPALHQDQQVRRDARRLDVGPPVLEDFPVSAGGLAEQAQPSMSRSSPEQPGTETLPSVHHRPAECKRTGPTLAICGWNASAVGL